jgi:hypothetical protein
MLPNHLYPTSGGNGSRYQQITVCWNLNAALKLRELWSRPSSYIIHSTDLWAHEIQLDTSERAARLHAMEK